MAFIICHVQASYPCSRSSKEEGNASLCVLVGVAGPRHFPGEVMLEPGLLIGSSWGLVGEAEDPVCPRLRAGLGKGRRRLRGMAGTLGQVSSPRDPEDAPCPAVR